MFFEAAKRTGISRQGTPVDEEPITQFLSRPTCSARPGSSFLIRANLSPPNPCRFIEKSSREGSPRIMAFADLRIRSAKKSSPRISAMKYRSTHLRTGPSSSAIKRRRSYSRGSGRFPRRLVKVGLQRPDPVYSEAHGFARGKEWSGSISDHDRLYLFYFHKAVSKVAQVVISHDFDVSKLRQVAG
jgi:hypothetical protein